MPGRAAHACVTAGRAASNQQDRGTEVEKSCNGAGRWSRWRQEIRRLMSGERNRFNVDEFSLLADDFFRNNLLVIAPDASASGELNDVIGIGCTGWLRKESQRTGDAMVLMPATLGIVMQHELHSAGAGLQERVMVRVHCPQQRHHPHAHR